MKSPEARRALLVNNDTNGAVCYGKLNFNSKFQEGASGVLFEFT